LKEVGRIIHYTKNKVFVIEAREKLVPDTVLLDSRGGKLGKVIDVIGPINRPYLVVKPSLKNPEKYVGAYVYYVKKRKRR